MTNAAQELRRLLRKLERLRPEDTAAVLEALPADRRHQVVDLVRNAHAGAVPRFFYPDGPQVSPWLLELAKPESALTDPARAVLRRHIATSSPERRTIFEEAREIGRRWYSSLRIGSGT